MGIASIILPRKPSISINLLARRCISNMAFRHQLLYAAWICCLTIFASAAPNVTVVPLVNTCASFPAYNDDTGIAAPLKVIADATGKSIDGYTFVPKYATAVGGGAWGFVRVSLYLELP